MHTGLFGGNETFVPVQGSDLGGDGRVTMTYDKAMVKGAPNVSEDGHLSREEEQELYRYYSLENGSADGQTPASGMATDTRASTADHDRRDRAGEPGIEGRDTSGPTTDEAMTRSEEQLRVGTEQRETGKARLRKHIVTENVSTTVPVSHEEVTVSREPITEANRGDALSGGDLTEETHEVTLTEQRAVVDKDVVPVEAGPAGHRDGDRPGAGRGDRPQGGHRDRRCRGHPGVSGPATPRTGSDHRPDHGLKPAATTRPHDRKDHTHGDPEGPDP